MLSMKYLRSRWDRSSDIYFCPRIHDQFGTQANLIHTLSDKKPVLLEIFRDLKSKPYLKANSNTAEDEKYPFPFNASYVGHKVKAILNDAGIDATAHDLRDSFVSHLIYLGYPLEDVSKMAGHSTIKITERYYYEQLEERRRSMLSDLGNHMTRSQLTTETDAVGKTCPENGEKKPL